MGTALCLGLLPVDADSPHGQHPLSVGGADVYPHGVGHPCRDHPDVHRHYHLLNDGRPEGGHLG